MYDTSVLDGRIMTDLFFHVYLYLNENCDFYYASYSI